MERKADAEEKLVFDPQDFHILDTNVPVNFIMYDKFGRSGIKYSASMLDVNVFKCSFPLSKLYRLISFCQAGCIAFVIKFLPIMVGNQMLSLVGGILFIKMPNLVSRIQYKYSGNRPHCVPLPKGAFLYDLINV